MPLLPWLTALTLSTLPLLALPIIASALQVGKDYLVLNPAQPTDHPNKVVVTEFFAYTCPHCFHFEPLLNAWIKKLPKGVVMERVPVIFSPSWEPMARAYYALKAMGALGKLHDKVFNAIHVQNQRLMHPDTFFDWGAGQGLDRAELKATYQSFTVDADIARAKEMARNYGIQGVPTLAIDGKYITSAEVTGSHKRALQVASELVRKELKALKHHKR